MIEFFWHTLLYEPLYNALIFFYVISPQQDMGLAVIFLTLFIRVLLLPFSIRSARSEHRMDQLQPTIDQIKERYKYNIERQKEGTKRLLRKNKIGIFSSLLSLGFQLVVFVVLYTIFSSGLQLGGYNTLYSFNLDPKVIDPFFLGWFDLTVPNQLVSLFAAGVVFLHQGARKVKNFADATTIEKALIFGLPIGTYAAVIILPSAKAVFIATTVIFSIWIRFIKWIVVRFILKDTKLKNSIDDLWTS